MTSLGLGLAAACGPFGQPGATQAQQTAQPSPRKVGGAIRVDVTTDPNNNLDFLRLGSPPTFMIQALVTNRVLRWDYANATLLPDLATALPTISSDGLTYTARLRAGVFWHDGKPFDSADVKYTFDVCLDPKNAIGKLGTVPRPVTVSAPDPTTVVFTLPKRFTPFLDKLAEIPIISSKIPYVPLQTYASTVVGTGPFRLTSYTPNVGFNLEKNAQYFGGSPVLDAIQFSIVPNDETRIANLVNGISHVMPFVAQNRISALQSRGAAIQIVERSQAAISMLTNQTTITPQPTRNSDFRLAVAWAVNRQQICDTVYGGAAVPASTASRPGSQYYDAQSGNFFGGAPDLDKAKAYLAKSGVDTKKRYLLVGGNNPQLTQIGPIVQANLKAIGLDFDLDITDVAGLAQHRTAKDYALYLIDNASNPNYPSADGYYSAVVTTSSGNTNGVGDAKMNQLIAAAEAADPGADAAKGWAAVHEYEVQLLPHIQLVTYKYIEAYSKKLVDYAPSAAGDLAGLMTAGLMG